MIAPSAWCWSISETPQLLDKEPVVQRSIRVRNPYVDPMNYIQVALLRRLRTETDPEAADRLRSAILLSVNGIAAGLQNVAIGNMKRSLTGVDGLLFDIDGVLFLGEEVIPGAAETISALRARGIPFRFMTNTTIYCRYTLLDRLHARGFRAGARRTVYSHLCGGRYLHDQKAQSYLPLLLPDAQLEFTGIDVDEENPEYVVVGDMGASFTFPRLNRAFRALLNGAKLVALHKKRHWRTARGPLLDAGPFVMALEYAAEQQRNRSRQAQRRLLPTGP